MAMPRSWRTSSRTRYWGTQADARHHHAASSAASDFIDPLPRDALSHGALRRALRLFEGRPLYSTSALQPRAASRMPRYTPKGGAPSIYLAADMETALREYTQIASPRLVQPAPLSGAPATYTVTAELAGVLDLTDAVILNELDTNPLRARRTLALSPVTSGNRPRTTLGRRGCAKPTGRR